MEETVISVNTVTEPKIVRVPFVQQRTYADDVCIFVCKQLGIGPVARHLFALREHGSKLFIALSTRLTEKSTKYDLRVRYKVANISKLKRIDIRAYDYYFHQARNDVLENKIPDIVYEKYRRELVGLGVADMYRVMVEKDIPRDIVENDYKKYIPKEVIKRHSFFIKKPIHDSLGKIKKCGRDAWYVKAEYLKQLEAMAPEYLAEEYRAVTDQDGSTCSVFVKVTPFHPTEPGVQINFDSKRENWQQLCTIHDLCFISVRNDGTVEISRKNGIPSYLKFNTLSSMHSFVSLLDGYYRLMIKWIFNLCKDLPTPSLQKLYALKCHGPVGGEFSYAKLEEKRANRPGCFILRESEAKYNTFYLDVCSKHSLKPKSYKLEKIGGDEFIFNDDLRRYKSIQQLMAAYSDPDSTVYLQECLPPSEYDQSPLLLCQPEVIAGDSLTDSSSIACLLPSAPLCINTRDLQVYKGQKKESKDGLTVVYRSMWKLTKGKKLEAAMKVLKHDHCEQYLKDFMELADQWAFLSSNAIVRLYGITLKNPITLVMEYVKLGPLDEYLRANRSLLKTVDLVEAASYLASALWHLEENGIVHGNIRCRRLLTAIHDDATFTVKLSDPGIHISYGAKDVHWIPVEYYSNLEYASQSPTADVWAFSTTLWEIFSYGEVLPPADQLDTMRFYATGKRLIQPPHCPNDIYQIMLECWDPDPHHRKRPQAVMRDINQILYQVFNSRKTHSYAKVFSKKDINITQDDSLVNQSTNSLFSNTTNETYLGYKDELLSVSAMSQVDSDLSVCSNDCGSSLANGSGQQLLHYPQDLGANNEDADSCDLSTILSNFYFSTTATSLDSINLMQSIFELDDDYNVVLQGRIGQGFYGEVFRGTLEYVGNKDIELRQVAVKKLKSSAVGSGLQDFEREIAIMKTLKHPNIVEILGVYQDPEVSLVMEFVQHGSLQSYLKIYRETLTTRQLLTYALDIAHGMDYLGHKHIVHRDLAARNILVVDEFRVKISDFGLAQVMGTKEYYILKTNRDLPIKWYAPESLRDGKFSPKSDVWSYGVTMYEMFSLGEEPRLAAAHSSTSGSSTSTATASEACGQEQQVLLSALENGARFPCPVPCPQAVYVRIIYPCWAADPHKRPSFLQLCTEIEDLLSQY